MAIKNTFTKKNNFGIDTTLSDCYCKVTQVIGNKMMISASVDVMNSDQTSTYFNQTFAFVPNMSGKNFIAQTYEHLKTLPEFDGATDC